MQAAEIGDGQVRLFVLLDESRPTHVSIWVWQASHESLRAE